MKDEEILVPEIKNIIVGDRTYQIGRLSLTQEFKIGRFLTKNLLSSQDKLKIVAEKTKDSTSNTEDILSILDLFNENDICEFIGIILKEDDIKFLIINLDLSIIVQIVTDVLECNKSKIENVKKNIPKIMQYVALLFQKKEKTN